MRSESCKAGVHFTNKQNTGDFKGWQTILFQWLAYSWTRYRQHLASAAVSRTYTCPCSSSPLKRWLLSHLCLLALLPQIRLSQSVAGNQRGQEMGREQKGRKIMKITKHHLKDKTTGMQPIYKACLFSIHASSNGLWGNLCCDVSTAACLTRDDYSMTPQCLFTRF